MLIHSATFSPNCRKIEAFIHEFELPIEIVPVDMKDPITKRPEFRELNPNGKIPCLVDGDYSLWESNAILTYLASIHPALDVLPSDPRARADVDKWLAWQASLFGPAVGGLFRPESAAKARQELAGLSEILDAQLRGRAFVVGPLSVVDFALGAYAACVPSDKFDFARFLNVAAWLTRVCGLKGFVATDLTAAKAGSKEYGHG